MPEDKPEEARDSALFMNLVMMLGSSAMQQLGKIVNPLTNKAETDLAGAQISIDLLEVLRRKTRGNLSAGEQGLLDNTLASLQMDYVETAGAAGDAPQSGTNAAEKAAPAEPEAGAPADAKKDRKDPKFHKTYG